MQNPKKNILNLTLPELEQYMESIGEPKYRAKQVFASLHGRQAASIDELTGIPKELKKKLDESFYVKALERMLTSDSHQYNTKKFLFELPGTHAKNSDKTLKIETVLISEKDRNTICVSTQVGCNVGCEFCATGKMGFMKNLDSSQVVSQVYEVIRATGIKPTNLVFMGMGEPFLNYDNMLKSLKLLTDKSGLDLSSRKITVSTVGFADKIKKFADDLMLEENKEIKNVKLALSLHSTDNGIREAIIPTSKKNKLSSIYDELVYFYRKTKNKITYEYIFFNGLNNTPEDVKRLEKLSKMIPCNINLIPFHPIEFELRKPLNIFNDPKNTDKVFLNKKLFDFIKELKSRSIVVNLRSSSGVDINAACGQLAVRE